MHPGVVATNLARNLGPVLAPLLASIGPLFLKSVGEGAATEVFAAVSPKALPLASNYLADSNVKKPRADAEDAALATPTSLQIGRVGSERARAWAAFARWWNRLRLIDRRRDHRGHRHRIARAAHRRDALGRTTTEGELSCNRSSGNGAEITLIGAPLVLLLLRPRRRPNESQFSVRPALPVEDELLSRTGGGSLTPRTIR